MKFNNMLKNNIFRLALLGVAAVLSIAMFFIKKDSVDSFTVPYKNQLIVFIQDGCIHCAHAEDFLNKNKFKGVDVIFYNLKESKSMSLLFESIERLNIPQENLGTPIFVFNDGYLIGFGREQESHLAQMIKEKKIK